RRQGTWPRSTSAWAARSATRTRSGRSRSGSRPPGCASSSPARASRPTGSTGSRERVLAARLSFSDRTRRRAPPGGSRQSPRGGVDARPMTNETDPTRTKETTMEWFDQPVTPAPTPPAAAPEHHAALGGVKRTVATAMLAIGLLVVGGVAVVNAADPSASPAPTTTTQPNGSSGTGNGGTTTPGGSAPRSHTGGNCPNMGGSGSGSGSSGSGGSSAPSTNGSTSSPSTSDL